MNKYQIYKFVNNPLVIILRGVIFFLFLVIIFLLQDTPQILDTALYLYTLFIINELFIHLKVNNSKPAKTVSSASDPSDALDFRVKVNLASSTIPNYINRIKDKPPQKFMQDKIGTRLSDIVDVPKDELLSTALNLARIANAKYITEIGIFASYLVLQEEKTNYLKSQNLSVEDIPYIFFWTRKRYAPRIERSDDLPFAGSGVFDFFVYGWNAELEKYAYDFTREAIKWGASAHAVGRVEEYDLLVKSLLKGRNNNALLIGEPGVGKTSLTAFFARESFNARLPGHLARIKVFALALDRLLAGANSQGELEERIARLLEEIAHTGNVIVYMANIELLFGGGGVDADLSHVLYDYLKSSKVQIIGTTTPEEYETVIKRHASGAFLFETILLREPDEKEARFMIFESIIHLERAYRASFSYDSITAAIEYADKYQTNLSLPGSAMILLEDVAADAALVGRRKISSEDILAQVQKKTEILLEEPTQDEKEVLLHLEETLNEMVIGQSGALSAISDAMRRLRGGFKTENKPIASFLFLGPTGVGKTQTAKALARVYFGAEENMIRLDMSEYNTPDSIKKLLGEMPGEDFIESLIAKVQERPFSLVLLDEFEKADSHVLDVFLQVLDDARLTNNKGETASFENAIIIATSNAGSEFIRENISASDLSKRLQEYLLEKIFLSLNCSIDFQK